jgi:hypothetical protein
LARKFAFDIVVAVLSTNFPQQMSTTNNKAEQKSELEKMLIFRL